MCLAGVLIAPSLNAQSDSAIAAFTRTELARRMKDLDVPGAVIVITRGDKVIMNEGLGFADMQKRIPVDPGHTLFRVASVAKIFTAMSALDLVNKHQVAIDSDIRPMIRGVTVGGASSEPLTLHHLLTHTSGIDDRLIGYLNHAGQSSADLSGYLESHMPPRNHAADDVPGYSNYGYALAGLLVERVTHRPFNEFVRDSIFAVLGMNDTRFLLQFGAGSQPELATEYRSDGRVRVPRSAHAYPAGSVATTGADMSRFLLWMNRSLSSPGTRRSIDRTAAQLISPALSYSPSLPPMGYGMTGVPIAGRTVWMKGGSAPSHAAVVAVIPDLGVSIFIALNRQEPLLWDPFIRKLVSQFWSQPTPTHVPAPLSADVQNSISGTYRWTRAPLRSVESLLGLFAQATVQAGAASIRVTGPEIDGDWAVRDSGFFENSEGRRMAFRSRAGEKASHLFSIVQGQPVAYERISVYETMPFQLATFVIAFALSVVGALATWRARTGTKLTKRAVNALPVCVALLTAAAVTLARNSEPLIEGATPLIYIALSISTLTAVIAVLQSASALARAFDKADSFVRRTSLALASAGGAAICWLLLINHLVGFQI